MVGGNECTVAWIQFAASSTLAVCVAAVVDDVVAVAFIVVVALAFVIAVGDKW